jgi:hypothetical protein
MLNKGHHILDTIGALVFDALRSAGLNARQASLARARSRGRSSTL